jgi:Nucleotidyltransferase of unknown function (DUF6036)
MNCIFWLYMSNPNPGKLNMDKFKALAKNLEESNMKENELVRYLSDLGKILESKGLKVTLIVVGGFVSVIKFKSRPSTADIDVVNVKGKNIKIEELVKLSKDVKNAPQNWLNMAARGFGEYEPEENEIIFKYVETLIIKPGNWIYQIKAKLNRLAKTDEDDIKEIIKYKKYTDSDTLISELIKCELKFPQLTDSMIKKIVENIWKEIK